MIKDVESYESSFQHVFFILLAATNCAYASDLQIFESIKIGDRFENICGTDGKNCHEINPLELTDVWLSPHKFPTNPTYKYSNKNDADILLRFDSFGFLYVKKIDNPDLFEDLKKKGYKLAVKNASFGYLNYGDIWQNDNSLLRIEGKGTYVFDIEGPFKRYT